MCMEVEVGSFMSGSPSGCVSACMYMVLLLIYRAFVRTHRSLLRIYIALVGIFWALLQIQRSLLRKCIAFLRIYRALVPQRMRQCVCMYKYCMCVLTREKGRNDSRCVHTTTHCNTRYIVMPCNILQQCWVTGFRLLAHYSLQPHTLHDTPT